MGPKPDPTKKVIDESKKRSSSRSKGSKRGDDELGAVGGEPIVVTGDDTSSLCTKCSKAVNHGDDAIQCERCMEWDCLNCSGMSKKIYEELVALKCLHYFCNSCQVPAIKAWKTDAQIEEICNQYLKKTEARLQGVEDSMKLKADKTEVDSINTTVTSLSSKINSLEQDLSTLNHRINLVRFEAQEKTKRKDNIIIRGLPESDDPNSDDKIVQHVLSEIGCDDVIPIETNRLGRKPVHKSVSPTRGEQADEASQDTSNQVQTGDGATSVEGARSLARPLRVTLSSGQNKFKILKNAKNIRKSKSSQFDPLKIFIVPDQTALEREDDLKLRKKTTIKKGAKP